MVYRAEVFMLADIIRDSLLVATYVAADKERAQHDRFKASPAGRRIASVRVRTRPTRLARRLCMLQRYDAFGLTRSARHTVHQIWVTDASARTDAMSARVLPRRSRPRMVATQRAGRMVVKGWPCRLTFYAASSLLSMQRHWQPAMPPDAGRCHFNADISA
jgi:hypothetical protein